MVYICEGDDKEKLEWFQTINIAGETLSSQELRNAVYSGTWVTSAKKYFLKNGCLAEKQGWGNYFSGDRKRQDWLETAIYWDIYDSKNKDKDICEYMSLHRHDENAEKLYKKIESIISWIEKLFKYDKEMKKVDWGRLFNKYHDKSYDPKLIQEEVDRLMADEDVTKKSGIYPYIFTREEKYLSIRAFRDSDKKTAYARQEGICPFCKKHFAIEDMEADHITPWSNGGHTTVDNCQMLCLFCNRKKGNE